MYPRPSVSQHAVALSPPQQANGSVSVSPVITEVWLCHYRNTAPPPSFHIHYTHVSACVWVLLLEHVHDTLNCECLCVSVHVCARQYNVKAIIIVDTFNLSSSFLELHTGLWKRAKDPRASICSTSFCNSTGLFYLPLWKAEAFVEFSVHVIRYLSTAVLEVLGKQL